MRDVTELTVDFTQFKKDLFLQVVPKELAFKYEVGAYQLTTDDELKICFFYKETESYIQHLKKTNPCCFKVNEEWGQTQLYN